MYRIYKETSSLSDSHVSSATKELVRSFSVLEEAEEKIQQIYDKYSNRIELISGTTRDFQVKDHDRRYPESNEGFIYDNCLVHYWLEETDYVYNGTEKICISGLDYDSIDDFYYGLSVVGKYGKYGLIDLNFNLVLGLYYKSINQFVFDKTLCEPICSVRYTDEEKGWVDQKGRFIVIMGKPTNKKELLLSTGRIPSDNVIWAYKSNCRWFRVELKHPSFGYESAYSFYDVESQSIAPALLQEGKHVFFAESDYINGLGIIKDRKTKKVGAINMNGIISVPVKYDELSSFSDNGIAVFCEDAKDVVEHFTPARYLDFKYKKGGKWGAIYENGEVRIPAKYDHAYAFSDGLAAVNLGGEYYIYLGQEPSFYLDSFIPQSLREMSFSRWFMGGKWGFVDENGNECIPIQYDKVSSFYNGISIVNKGGRWIGGSLQNSHDSPRYIQQMPTFIEGKYGIINKKGELIVPMIYSSLFWDDNTPNPTFLHGLIGGELMEEDGQYYIVAPEKEVYISPEGKVIEEYSYENAYNLRWPV